MTSSAYTKRLSGLEDIARDSLKDDGLCLSASVKSQEDRLRNFFAAWRSDWEESGLVPNERGVYGIPIANVVAGALEGSNPYFIRACLEAASEFIRDDIPFPRSLAGYVSDFCKASANRVSRSPTVYDNEDRNMALGQAVIRVAEEGNIIVTRPSEHKYEGSEKLSACYVVSRVVGEMGFSITEASVEAAWKAVRDVYLPPGDPDSYTDGKRRPPRKPKLKSRREPSKMRCKRQDLQQK